MKDLLLDLIDIMGPWGFSLFLMAVVAIVALGVFGIFHDVNENPDHWSRKGNVHDWSPKQDA